MKLKWKINLIGFENYRFDTDGNIYRLPTKSEDGKFLGLKKLKKDGNRWWFKVNGKAVKWSESQLKGHLIKDENPIELMDEKDCPF